ncbi:MAG: type II toxin-antitoxin system HicA family toxin [Dehalococcoidia bacterium]|nr:type II toxin-antitoxin system HicA family toxin [Dehalococcoidia bacterium]
MPPTPLLTFDETLAGLHQFGYRVARQTGSHVRLRAPGRPPVTVPRKREIPRGTLRAILKAADISQDAFVQALSR